MQRPEAAIQLASGFILLLLLIYIIVVWSMRFERGAVEVPLLLIGVFGILAMVVRTTNAFAIGISIVIVGTVVAGERSTTFMTAILKGTDTEQMAVLANLYSDGKSSQPAKADAAPTKSDKASSEMFADVISTVASKNTSPQVTEKFVNRALTSYETESLANRIDEEGASFPFRRLAIGGSTWQDFVNAYRDLSAFIEDMNFLKGLGVIEFTGQDFGGAYVTDRGERVLQRLNGESLIPAERLPEPEAVQSLDDTSIVPLQIGDKRSSEFVEYRIVRFKIEVPEAMTIQIRTMEVEESDQLIDTTIKLKDASLIEIAYNDDSATDLFSDLTRKVQAGHYLIEVENLTERAGKFAIEVSRVTE